LVKEDNKGDDFAGAGNRLRDAKIIL